MCGIFGFISNEKANIDSSKKAKILNGLFLLSESRGKEASGFAFVREENIIVYKNPFTASQLIKSDIYQNQLDLSINKKNTVAIGHSRLVTNGYEQLNENNQPVIKNRIVGIHNGIVVNVDKLWGKFLDEKKNTELDSELIFTLIKKFYTQSPSLKTALLKTFSEIYGMTSIAMILAEYNNLLLATNNGSLYYVKSIDNNSFIFASEFFILKTLITTYHLSTNFNIKDIKHLEANNACLVNIVNTEIDFFKYNQYHKDDDFSNVNKRNREFKIINLSKKNTNDDFSDINQNVIFTVSKEFFKHRDKCEEQISKLRHCTKCLLPETFPFIKFDEKGECNYCGNYQKIDYKGKEALKNLVEPFRKRNNEPDVLIPFSGGRDSSYSLHYIKTELEMNPIAFSYDWGMITDLARRNQARLCGKLGIEHILISADIRKKRRNIRKNVLAWLKHPNLGTIPLFMAGDKQYFYYTNLLMQQNNLQLSILGENMLETTNFKSGFCGIKPNFKIGNTYSLSTVNKIKMSMFYGKEFILNPSYLNSSIFDTLDAFKSYYITKHNNINMYNFIKWDEKVIEQTLFSEYDWETSPDTPTTWRIGDGTASFYNYIYYIISGFTENDTFRSNQIREGMLTRDEAMKLAEEENRPRYESIKWYCDTIGIDFESTIRRINEIPKLYE